MKVSLVTIAIFVSQPSSTLHFPTFKITLLEIAVQINVHSFTVHHSIFPFTFILTSVIEIFMTHSMLNVKLVILNAFTIESIAFSCLVADESFLIMGYLFWKLFSCRRIYSYASGRVAHKTHSVGLVNSQKISF